MADQNHLSIFMQGADAWNKWKGTVTEPDLSGVDLSGKNLRDYNFYFTNLSEANLSNTDISGGNLIEANLRKANLSRANLTKASLQEAHFTEANLTEADLRNAHLPASYLGGATLNRAKLNGAVLSRANLPSAELRGADLSGANLIEASLAHSVLNGAILRDSKLDSSLLLKADLSDADLSGAQLSMAQLNYANLDRAKLFKTNLDMAQLNWATLRGAIINEASLGGVSLIAADLEGAVITNSYIHGISAWDINGVPAIQSSLIISGSFRGAKSKHPTVVVDNLEVAQFVHLLLNHRRIRDLFHAIGQKAVLILGRFTPERKEVLDSLATALRDRGFIPIIFDFDKPQQKDFTETIMTLAGLCLFVIADITNPKSSPLELQATVPNYMIPFVPIIQEGESPFSMFEDIQRKYDWVLQTLVYDSKENLIAAIESAVIVPALTMHEELVVRKSQQLSTRHIKQFLNDAS